MITMSLKASVCAWEGDVWKRKLFLADKVECNQAWDWNLQKKTFRKTTVNTNSLSLNYTDASQRKHSGKQWSILKNMQANPVAWVACVRPYGEEGGDSWGGGAWSWSLSSPSPTSWSSSSWCAEDIAMEDLAIAKSSVAIYSRFVVIIIIMGWWQFWWWWS